MAEIQDPTLAGCKGERRLRKLKERVAHIDEQIAELQDKKGIMEHEIRQLKDGC